MEPDSTANYASLHDGLPQLKPNGEDIRLVVLQAGQPSDDLKCSLIVTKRQDVKYEALSYTWQNIRIPEEWEDSEGSEDAEEWEDVGDSDNEDAPDSEAVGCEPPSQQASESAEKPRQVLISVNDLLVYVMPNLADALFHLRLPDSDRTLWIDFLCINQGSDLDRTVQVRRMDEIYASAVQVIVWLGLEEDDSEQGFLEVSALTSDMHLSQLYALEQSQGNLIERLKPLVNLLSRPWFQRVWVAQEVGLAQEAVVHVGSRTMPWISFLKAARNFRQHLLCCSEVVWPFLRDLDGDYWLKLRAYWADVLAFDATKKDFLTLLEALRYFHGRLATDPRDKVFGILGLLKTEERIVMPDYALSAPEVYQQTTVAIINHTKNLSVLIDIDEYVGSVSVPSWCVDWTQGAVFGLNLIEFYNAARDTTATACRCSEDTLKLRGLVIDEISEVIDSRYTGSSNTVIDDLLVAIRDLHKWEQLACHSENTTRRYPTGETLDIAFSKTVLMGVSVDRSRCIKNSDAISYNNWRNWIDKYFNKPARDKPAFLKNSIRRKVIREHNEVLVSYPAVRWFFKTSNGYFGLGPLLMEEGDVVCVLAGGSTPFILRELNETCETCGQGQNCWRLMGYAYVHGFMDGEAVTLVDEGKKEWRHFCLR